MAEKVAKKTEDVKVITIKKKVEKPVEKRTVVKCVSSFYDIRAGLTRYVGDQWEVDSERLTELKTAQKAQGITLVEVL